jgi:hypothetical protein
MIAVVHGSALELGVAATFVAAMVSLTVCYVHAHRNIPDALAVTCR